MDTNFNNKKFQFQLGTKEREKEETHINSWIKHDPTLPHMHTIKCPNEKCKSNEKDQTSDIIYFRYNDTNMKYMYLCTICDFNWKP